MDQKGYPILPPLEVVMGKDLKYRKLLVGKYMGAMYRV